MYAFNCRPNTIFKKMPFLRTWNAGRMLKRWNPMLLLTWTVSACRQITAVITWKDLVALAKVKLWCETQSRPALFQRRCCQPMSVPVVITRKEEMLIILAILWKKLPICQQRMPAMLRPVISSPRWQCSWTHKQCWMTSCHSTTMQVLHGAVSCWPACTRAATLRLIFYGSLLLHVRLRSCVRSAAATTSSAKDFSTFPAFQHTVKFPYVSVCLLAILINQSGIYKVA